MSRKLFTAPLALFALALLAGTVFVPTSSAASGFAPAVMQNKTSALTAQGIVNARKANAPSRLVTMRPQSSLALLERQAVKLGMHAPNSRIKIIVGLKLRNVARLKSFLEQAQNPASPMYHQWLTPRQFTRLYGPSKTEVARVVAFLRKEGITVESVSPNRTLIHTVATTKTYNHAFAIEINDYKLDGRRFYSTTDSPRLPRAIASRISGILGLNHGVRMRPLSSVKALGQVAPQAAPPPSTAYFSPQQIAKAYDWPDITNSGNGAGVSIAILTANSPNVADNPNFSTFWNAYGLSDHSINVTPIGGQSGTGGEGETALDIEWSGAMAPGAKLNVYVAADASLATFVTMFNQFANDNNSEVMTISWGASETSWGSNGIATAEQIFMQAAAQGISMFCASGDWGADNDSSEPNMADYPSSSVYITSANGTELTIADLSGTYGNEHAWADTGGAISQYLDRPDWQVAPGMPTDIDMRMNSDMALNAGPLHPFVVRAVGASGAGYYGFYGTSAVSPIFAGLFAIAVSQQPGGERLGQSNKLIYDAINAIAQNYPEDFRDITEGCNGYLPDGTTKSCAKTDWDHPTGLGSPKASKLLADISSHAPAGTLTGTVTASPNGASVAGAIVTVNPGGFTRTTQEDGSYSINLLAGDYSVTVSAYGYEAGAASVSITNDQTTNQDFTLSAAPLDTVSGALTDGSGHGYPLYGVITVSTPEFGQVAEAWTDPETGHYSLELPEGFDYNVMAAAAFNGYNSSETNLTLTGDQTRNFALTVTATCTAPGYTFSAAGGFSQDFNGDSFPPDGWQVTSAIDGAKVIWKLNSAWDKDNVTGGTGTAADADSAAVGSGPYDTSLVTPSLPVTSLPTAAILRYKANYIHLADALDLDISTDGGASWTTLSHWTSDHGTRRALPGYDVERALPLPATGSVQLRWHYYSDPGDLGYNWYAMIDDVVIGACQPVPGGLVLGRVTSAVTGDGIDKARVEDDQGAGADTLTNPDDPNLPVGTYTFFAKAGKRSLTATAAQYSPAEVQVNLTNNAVVQQNFVLKSGKLVVDPEQLTLHVEAGGEATRTLTVKNIGQGGTTFRVISFDAPPPSASGSAGRTSVIRHPLGNPAWMSASLSSLRAQAYAQGRAFTLRPAARAAAPNDASWLDIAPYPVPIGDNTAARDPATGKVYTMGGFNADGKLNSAFVYDPETDRWAPIADAPVARASAASAFVNGKYYVFNGWDDSAAANPVAEVDIYDPATGAWSAGTPNPVPAGGGSAIAVSAGRVFIVGGCNNGTCQSPLSAVQVYDPVRDNWSSLTDYPNADTFAACGSIRGKLYCAGGVSGGAQATAGFVYDPVADSWTPIADAPLGISGSFYTSANGLLLLSGGIVNGAISNQGVVYDPATDSWTDLPPASIAAARGAGACGFYRIGGITAISASGATITDHSEQLPGYDQRCGTPPSIPWLTIAPNSGTLAAGAAATVTLTFDGNGQKADTTSNAYLRIVSDTPHGALTVPLTVSWDTPKPVDLVLTGTANPDPVAKGGQLTYTLTVKNRDMADHGPATGTTLSYALPEGVSYIAADGDASCSTPASGAVACDFGTVGLGVSKTVTIKVEASQLGTLSSTFEVSANESDSDPSTNSVTIATKVVNSTNGGDGGGGALGLWLLAALLALGMSTTLLRHRRRQRGEGL